MVDVASINRRYISLLRALIQMLAKESLNLNCFYHFSDVIFFFFFQQVPKFYQATVIIKIQSR